MKKIMAIILVTLLVLPSVAMAGDVEDPVTGSVKTVARAAQGTVETAVSPIKALGSDEPGNVVVDPLEKGGETVSQAVVDTGKAATAQKVD